MYRTKTYPYIKLKQGDVFRVTKPEVHKGRIVKNGGIYFKMGDSHSIDLVKDATAIFHPLMECVKINANSDFASKLLEQKVLSHHE